MDFIRWTARITSLVIGALSFALVFLLAGPPELRFPALYTVVLHLLAYSHLRDGPVWRSPAAVMDAFSGVASVVTFSVILGWVALSYAAFVVAIFYLLIVAAACAGYFCCYLLANPETDDYPKSLMPRYQCHKQVCALKISRVTSVGSGDSVQWYLEFEREDHARRPVTFEFLKKHNPHAGMYFVLYDDGYESMSPAEAFESGYEQIDSRFSAA